MPKDLTAQLQRGLASLDLELGHAQQSQLLAFIALLLKWNRVYNLTAVRDAQEVLKRHILDSLSILPYLQGERIIDVGAGAGLPGIPLAITNPDRLFVLLDSNRKKTRFMQQAKTELHLDNVAVVCSRAEDYHPDEPFDSVISRALASLSQIVAWSGHLCREKAVILAMKGTYPEAELEELAKSFEIKAVHKLNYWGLDADRYLVEISAAKS
ncbi:16S rRNA (guanine(527)-N(7))-methyltransferase RsmG [Kaarinaea lacus]